MAFDTPLTPAEETKFQAWKALYAPNDSGEDYDLRGAFKAGLTPDPTSGHLADTFKKPNHPTFSNESQYAPYGNPGYWTGANHDQYVAGNPGAKMADLDFNSILANALGQLNNSPTPVQAPPLTSGTPLIPRDMMSSIVSRAFQPDAPLQPQDRDDAIIRLGTALMKPRMPGESVAGNAGAAIQGSSDQLQRSQAMRTQQATQQAALASTVAAQDQAQRQSEMQMEAFKAKWPAEFAQVQETLKQLQLSGQVQRAQALQTLIATQPEVVAQKIRLEMNKAGADIGKVEADTRESGAKVGYYEGMANYLNGGKGADGKLQKLSSYKTDDGQIVNSYMKGGKVYHEFIQPGITDPQVAVKLAEKQLREERGVKPYNLVPAPKPEEIAERAKALMQPKTTILNANNQQVEAALPSEDEAPTASVNTAPAKFESGTTPTDVPAPGAPSIPVSSLPAGDQPAANMALDATAAGRPATVKGPAPATVPAQAPAAATPAAGAVVVTPDMLARFKPQVAPAADDSLPPIPGDQSKAQGLRDQLVAAQKDYRNLMARRETVKAEAAKKKVAELKKQYDAASAAIVPGRRRDSNTSTLRD